MEAKKDSSRKMNGDLFLHNILEDTSIYVEWKFSGITEMDLE